MEGTAMLELEASLEYELEMGTPVETLVNLITVLVFLI